jgi:hypothetical protein
MPVESPFQPEHFLVHYKIRDLYVGLSLPTPESPEGSAIARFQFCDLCASWLKTGGSGCQNGEKHFKQKYSRPLSPPQGLMASEPMDQIADTWQKVIWVIDKLLPISAIRDADIIPISSTYRLWQIMRSLKRAVEKKITDVLSRVERLALVEDGWTDLSQRNYEGLWAHGMLDGRRLSFCIGQIPVGRADSATLAPAIAARLSELGLMKENNHDIAFIVGYSASVNPKIVSLFNQVTGNESFFLPCIAHALNNMVQAIWGILRIHIQSLLIILDTLRNNGAFNRYVIAKNLKADLGNPDDTHGITRIALALAVRWYSLTKMLTIALSLRPLICRYMREELTQNALNKFITEGVQQASVEILGVSHDRVFTDSEINDTFLIQDETSSQPDRALRVIGISDDQWEYATMANKLFGHFKDVTLSLEGEQFGTVADIWSGFLWIEQQVQTLNHPDVNNGWKDAMAVWRRWQAKYPTIPTNEQKEAAMRITTPDQIPDSASIRELSVPLFQVTALLRPSNIPQIRTRLGTEPIWNNTVACLKTVFDSVKYQIPEWTREQELIARQTPATSTEPTRFGRFHTITIGADLPGPRLTEWERYMTLQIHAEQDAELELWWRNHATEFPVFYYISQMYLFVPGTSAGVERMFSVARRILTRLRLRMRPENAELLVFLHENIETLREFQQAGDPLP